MARILLKFVSIVSLSLLLWIGLDGKSFDPSTPSASAEATATSATPKYKTVAIREIQPAGYKVLADNPQTPGQAAGDFGEFDPKTWQVHRFLMTKPNGGWLKIGLARPVAWIESVERNDSGQVWLEFEELGIADWATLQGTESCPSDILGEGRRVTGTFEHSSGEVLNLYIAGEATPIGSTANHPFWSEDRQDFVQAGSLNPGEHLRLADGRTTTLERTEPIAEQLPVYNLEVDGEHVYFVGESGVLVHNAGSEYSLRGKHPNKVSQQLLDKNPSWKREPADKGHGWKLVDENGVERYRYMYPNKNGKYPHEKSGYVVRKNADGDFLDIDGKVLPKNELLETLKHLYPTWL
jgi:hypothetical protein